MIEYGNIRFSDETDDSISKETLTKTTKKKNISHFETKKCQQSGQKTIKKQLIKCAKTITK